MVVGRCTSSRYDRGQAVVMVAVVMVLCSLGGIAVVDTVAVMHARQRAQVAADAAALAAVSDGRRGAERLAASNGAVVVEVRVVDGDVVVETEVRVTGITGERWVRATARASDLP